MNTANVQFISIIVAILAGIFFNNRAVDKLDGKVDRLEDKMNARFTALDARIDRIFSELGTFHSIQGEHKAKIDALEKR